MNAKEFELSRVITVEVLRAAGRCTGGGFFFGPKAPALTDEGGRLRVYIEDVGQLLTEGQHRGVTPDFLRAIAGGSVLKDEKTAGRYVLTPVRFRRLNESDVTAARRRFGIFAVNGMDRGPHPGDLFLELDVRRSGAEELRLRLERDKTELVELMAEAFERDAYTFKPMQEKGEPPAYTVYFYQGDTRAEDAPEHLRSTLRVHPDAWKAWSVGDAEGVEEFGSIKMSTFTIKHSEV